MSEVNSCLIGWIALDAGSDPVHHLNRFQWILAGRAFGRKHHGVGTIINRGCNVADLGSCRSWRRHHQFEHLGRNDDGLSKLPCTSNDLVLERRDLLGRKLDPKVTARNHDRVGKRDDVGQLVDRCGLFDFRKKCGALTDQRPCFGNILGPLNEGQRNPVGPLLERKMEIVAILVGQRRDRNQDIGNIDALVVGYGPADFDFGKNMLVIGFKDVETHLSIVDENVCAMADRFEQLGMRKLNAVAVAGS